jgi:hypothetical protein
MLLPFSLLFIVDTYLLGPSRLSIMKVDGFDSVATFEI